MIGRYLANSDYGVMIRTVWQLAKGRRRELLTVYAGLGCASLFSLTQPIIVGGIVRTATEGGPDMLRHLYPWLAGIILNTIGFWCFNGPARYVERRVAFFVRTRMTDKLYSGITDQPWAWHQSHHSGNTLNRMNFATQAVYSFTDSHFLWFETVTRLAGSLIFLVWTSPPAGLVFVVAMPVLVFAMQRINKQLMAISRRQNEAEHQVAAGLVDYLGNIATVLTLRLQQVSRIEVLRRLAGVWTYLRRQIVLIEIKWCIFVVSMETAGAAAILFYVLWHQADAPAVLAGALATLLQYLRMINIAVRSMVDRQQELMAQRVNIEGVSDISSLTGLAIAGERAEAQAWRQAEVKGLRFRYEDQEHQTHQIDDIGLSLKRGGRIALVGESGSGKSTLLRILRGLHELENGELTMDGATVAFSILSDITTLVPQDAEIFENTLRYNIAFGIADESGLDNAIAMACLESVIEPLEQGLDTDIREKGVNLSGGQKQRLALARGLFAAKDSSLLLLDEPTSSLDPVTEAMVYDRIFAGLQDVCIVSSVHRLHLLGRFDYIYVLADGRIVEQGTLADLTAAKGKLDRMLKAQQRDAEREEG